MSKPKVLSALYDLDKAGYYDNTTLLGNAVTTSSCLNVLVNGIYAFKGSAGETSPITTGTDTSIYKWSLQVYANEDSSQVLQIAQRFDNIEIKYIRTYMQGSGWTSWISLADKIKTISQSDGVITPDNNGNVTVDKVAYAINAAKLGNVASTNYLLKQGGTMTGDLKAVNSALSTHAVRNIYAGTTDMTAGTTALTKGVLYCVYE